MTLTITDATASTRSLSPARLAAWLAASLLLANGVVGVLNDPAALADHSTGAGALSEVTAGLAFLAGAVALLLLTPVSGWRRALWALAPLGLTVGGATMLLVPLTGSEPPGWLFLLGVVPTFVGLIVAGALGTGRVWPWWTGVGLALFLPIMFLLPFNSIPMAAVWAAVALTSRAVTSRRRAGS